METTPSQIEALATEFPDFMDQGDISRTEWLTKLGRHLPKLTEVGQHVFGNWSQMENHQ